MISHRHFLNGLAAAVLLLPPDGLAVSSQTSAGLAEPERASEAMLAAYRALASSQSRNYDRTQDISPRQLLLLLEVSERAGANLGQALATGEQESAATWNDHVRPPLKNGSLGSATGVWQFQPATFHRIIERYGTQLLAASEADAERERLDLGAGPFTDTAVRRLIRDTVNGKRGANDEELQLLRHNFAVLAFAKHYLSLDSGATTPEEDYLYHFLGAGQGRRILELARGEARATLCVKLPEVPVPASAPEIPANALAGDPAGAPAGELAGDPVDNVPRSVPNASPPLSRTAPTPPPASRPFLWEEDRQPGRLILDDGRLTLTAREAFKVAPPVLIEPARDAPSAYPPAVQPVPPPAPPPVPAAPPPVSSAWGLPADSPIVTGNPGMFYRDGKGQSQPYTWAEFMEHLARRVRADRQPELVRAKYGVGFDLPGGDLPEYAFQPERTANAAEFWHTNGLTVRIPEALITGPLNRDETERYRVRLAALLRAGEDRPLDSLPPEIVSALRHLTGLPASVSAGTSDRSARQEALRRFRALVGKRPPDDPTLNDRLLPAERVALELYDRRLVRYAALQAGQQEALRAAPDLRRIQKMSPRARRSAAFHLVGLQQALGEQGLLAPSTKKTVWRDKKRKKHTRYITLPFAGQADPATVAALDAFQWRHGLRKTAGVLDAVTLDLLNLPPLAPDIFAPLSGPHCTIPTVGDADLRAAPACAIPSRYWRRALGDFIPLSAVSQFQLKRDCPNRSVLEAVRRESSAPDTASGTEASDVPCVLRVPQDARDILVCAPDAFGFFAASGQTEKCWSALAGRDRPR